MNYLTHLYLSAMQHPSDIAWTSLGFLGSGIFGIRFLIQWLKSEKEGHSVIPITFWYCSLVGGLISVFYVAHLGGWPLLIQTCLPLPIYGRNIWMIYRDRGKA